MRRAPFVRVTVAFATTALWPGIAAAHGSEVVSWGGRADVPAVLGIAAATYLIGWSRLRQRGRAAAPTRHLVLYLVGLGALVAALLSPLDAAALETLPAHMLQHLLLTMIAAPAFVLSDVLPVVSWSIPAAIRPAVAATVRKLRRGGLAPATSLPAASLLMAATLWLWHLPSAYEAALARPWVHDLEHTSFFASALVFWAAVVDPAPRLQRATGDVARIVALFGATIQNTVLAAWIALAGRVLYPHYAARPEALAEQQVAGVVMLAGGAMMYIAAAVLVAARILVRGDAAVR
jgi:putative membrane protein